MWGILLWQWRQQQLVLKGSRSSRGQRPRSINIQCPGNNILSRIVLWHDFGHGFGYLACLVLTPLWKHCPAFPGILWVLEDPSSKYISFFVCLKYPKPGFCCSARIGGQQPQNGCQKAERTVKKVVHEPHAGETVDFSSFSSQVLGMLLGSFHV